MSMIPHWIVTKPEHCGGWYVVEHAATGKSIDESGDGGFEEATAAFIADAFNVQVETGKSPCQLADEVERLTRERADMAIVPRKITPAIESAFLRWARMCCDDPAVFWEAMVNAALTEQQP